MLPLKPSTNKKPPRQSQNFLRFAERRQGEVKQKEELGAMTAALKLKVTESVSAESGSSTRDSFAARRWSSGRSGCTRCL